jgi:hypothetical protein
MRILRGLSSRVLPCGCLVGVYETYTAEVALILDARGAHCADPNHQSGATLPLDLIDDLATVSHQTHQKFERRG